MFGWNQRISILLVPAVSALLVWGCYFVYQDKVIKGGFWRMPDPEELFLYMQMPAGTDVTLVTETLRLFEESIAPVEEGVRMRSTTFDYRGFIRIEFEDDIMAMQELIWRIKPDLIIETGIARGGSILFYASMMEMMGIDGKVVGIDIDIRPHNRKRKEAHPSEYLRGAVDPVELQGRVAFVIRERVRWN